MKPFLTVLLLAYSTIANAQNEPSNYRSGILIGTSVGISSLNLKFPAQSLTNNGPALNWKVGYSLNPKFAIVLNGSVSIYNYNSIGRPRKRDFGGVFPSVQYWISERFWFLGGVGLGTDAPVFYDIKPENKDELKYHTGFGLISSVGYEIYGTKNFTIDIQAKIGYSSVNLPEGKTNGFSTGLLLGINFY